MAFADTVSCTECTVGLRCILLGMVFQGKSVVAVTGLSRQIYSTLLQEKILTLFFCSMLRDVPGTQFCVGQHGNFYYGDISAWV